MLCEISIIISMQKIRRFPALSRNLWPKNADADSLRPGHGGHEGLTIGMSQMLRNMFHADSQPWRINQLLSVT